MFNQCFKGKTVLITGHTGFKGSWLSAWLVVLGARVVGVALTPTVIPSHFNEFIVSGAMTSLILDIRDKTAVHDAFAKVQPDFVFHLAAQALVRRSYELPLETWGTNLMGTLHVLEALRELKRQCSVVLITSDKCYENSEWVWGYRESDPMGGLDPYSASKGASELAIRSHIKSYFSPSSSQVRIASARAGNVIGGGDWAVDRIVPDCVRAWSGGHSVSLRNPNSTRPWQHVLEPLSGYLNLAAALVNRPDLHGEPFNFGPKEQQNHSVLDLVKNMALYWDQVRWNIEINPKEIHEAALLKLNCDKALHCLNWMAVMSFDDTVRMTAEWYRNYYKNPNEINKTTGDQIKSYGLLAKQSGLAWAK